MFDNYSNVQLFSLDYNYYFRQRLQGTPLDLKAINN